MKKRTESPCAIDGCERRVKARGWCETHYMRWVRRGSPHITLRPGSVATNALDRLMTMVTPVHGLTEGSLAPSGTPCWITPYHLVEGYVQVEQRGSERPGRVQLLAHRLTYERFVGPIAEGLHVDHLCRNRACCNPVHLDAVTPQVNAQRALPFRKKRAEH